ncbi:MAG TPA: hypothetical protein VFW96_23765 [Thermomicrobiales bacterium]|nr:hypothetical protein [Thermomicrobiales bacterium]
MAERRYMTHNAVVSVGPQGPGRSEIDHFMRAYHTLLRSSGEVQIRALLGPYLALNSALHVGARDAAPDLAALTYASLRLPAAIAGARLVLLGQSAAVFARHGYAHVLGWRRVTAPGRRRLMLYDGDATLAVLIASPSDIDDLIPMLLAYELEWNKLHALLNADPALVAALLDAPDGAEDDDLAARVREALGLGEGDWARLALLWDGAMLPRLREIARGKKHFAVRLLGGSANDYEQVTEQWWRHVCAGVREAGGPDLDLTDRPLYFVSSNTHSLVNLLSGYALTEEAALIDYIREGHPDLWAEYEGIRAQQVRSSWENFLYYVAKKYLREPGNDDARARRTALERAAGITHVTSRQFLDLHAQVIEVARLDPARLDPRLQRPDLARLRESAALILNIDYPLGWAAYQVLAAVSAHVADLRGVYVMGKAATLNGRIGDVMIANHFYDEHSRNTYLVDNCFIAQDVEPDLVYGSVLDRQRAVATYGTFLQSEAYMDLLYRDGYTILEAEAGPYLDALYEDTFPTRYPTDEVVNLYGAPCEVGLIHYASDTPYSKGQNLGARNLSYAGMDPTYASALAIARRILAREVERCARDETIDDRR